MIRRSRSKIHSKKHRKRGSKSLIKRVKYRIPKYLRSRRRRRNLRKIRGNLRGGTIENLKKSIGDESLINICVLAGEGIPTKITDSRVLGRENIKTQQNINEYNIYYKNVSVSWSENMNVWTVSWHDGEIRTFPDPGFLGGRNVSELISFLIYPDHLLLLNFFANGKKKVIGKGAEPGKYIMSTKEDFNKNLKMCYKNDCEIPDHPDIPTAGSDWSPSLLGMNLIHYFKNFISNEKEDHPPADPDWSPSLLGMNLIYYFKNLLSNENVDIKLKVSYDTHHSNTRNNRNSSNTFYTNYGFNPAVNE
jgi:hypothetical protein